MPGRGNPWQEGGAVDQTIVSQDIKDGSVSEVDLDSALQAKVNSGGGFDAVTTFRYFDDFVYNTTGQILETWDEFGTNPSLDAPGFDTSEYGTMSWSTSIVSGERQGLRTTSGPLFNGGDSYTLKWNFKLDDATNTVATIGGTNGETVNGTTASVAEGGFDDGAWFSLDSATSTNWICKTRSGGGSVQTTDSGVAGNTSFRDFEIVVTRGSDVVFKIDGATVATHSTEVPSDEADMMLAINNKTGTSQDCEIDYILIEAPRT
ncbi:MAG: hypothetical protein V3V41_02105 [Candidatus Heimdallarchaeota archaeon]